MMALIPTRIEPPLEFPDPASDPLQTSAFLQNYAARYYHQPSSFAPNQQFTLINGEELYIANIDTLETHLGDFILALALYRDLHWRSKFAAVCIHLTFLNLFTFSENNY